MKNLFPIALLSMLLLPVHAQDAAAAAAARNEVLAQARGVQLLNQESRVEKRRHFTTAYKGGAFYEVPQGKRRPASSSRP